MVTVNEDSPRLCNDSTHDDRWCSTCEAMWDGIGLFLDQMGLDDEWMETFAAKMKEAK